MVYALDISGLVPIECLTIRHGKPDLKIGEIKINIIFNSQGVELFNALPNNSVCYGDDFLLRLRWRIFDVLLLIKQQFFEITTWLKSYPILL